MISIILITYNRLNFLKKTIGAIFQEKKINFELIIWDNASTDGTKEYLESLKYSNIKIIYNDKNIGQNAYNKAIEKSNGKFILEVDDDILYLPENWLSDMLNAYQTIPNIGYLASNVVQDKYTNGAKPDMNNYKVYKYGNVTFEEGPAGGWCTLFSREIYNMVGGFIEFKNLIFYLEDGDFSGKIINKGFRAGILREVKAYHATGQILNDEYKNVYESKMKSFDEYMDIINKNKLNNLRPLISIIIVNWQVKDYLRKCLLSIEKTYGKKYDLYSKNNICPLEVIVIDNASTDGSVSMVRNEFLWVKLIVNLNNKGFASANNQGIKISHGKYILLLNPDTEIIEDSFFKMAKFLEDHKDIGALGCKLIYPDGKLQPSCRKFPTVELALWEQQGDIFLKNPKNISDEYFMKDMNYDIETEVDQPMGAALMVTREALNNVGGYMDKKYFMFFDEVDLCFRLKKKGWKIFYFPETKIIHYRAKSVEKSLKENHKLSNHFNNSMFRFLWKHYKKKFVKIILLKLVYIYNKLFNISPRSL